MPLRYSYTSPGNSSSSEVSNLEGRQKAAFSLLSLLFKTCATAPAAWRCWPRSGGPSSRQQLGGRSAARLDPRNRHRRGCWPVAVGDDKADAQFLDGPRKPISKNSKAAKVANNRAAAVRRRTISNSSNRAAAGRSRSNGSPSKSPVSSPRLKRREAAKARAAPGLRLSETAIR